MQADRGLPVLPLSPVAAPPFVQPEAQLAEVLAPDAVLVPADHLDALLAQGEAVVQLELEFGLAGDTAQVAALAARAPDRVERLLYGRSRDLRGGDGSALGKPRKGRRGEWVKRRGELRTDPRRAVADDDVGVAEAVLVFCDEVPPRVDADDEGAEGLVPLDERVKEGLPPPRDPLWSRDALELFDGEL